MLPMFLTNMHIFDRYMIRRNHSSFKKITYMGSYRENRIVAIFANNVYKPDLNYLY